MPSSVPVTNNPSPPARLDRNTVLGKSMLVMTAFTSRDRGLTFTDLVARTGLSKSTLHRICSSMVGAGLLERSSDRYRLSLLMFELGMRASLERDLLEVSTPFLEELRAAVNETVHLGVRDGTEVVYIAKLVGHRKVDVPSSTGGRLGLYCTAVGKALLAHAPADVQHDVLRDPLVRRTPRTITAPGVLAHQLVQVRSEGVAFEYEESRVGVVCVAAPVFGPGGALMAAVSVAGPVTRFHPARHADRVRDTARGISGVLARRTSGDSEFR